MIPRVFLVTGCASGIGRAVVDALCDRGDRVVATDINEVALRDHAAGRWNAERVVPRRLDVCDAANWQAVVDDTVERFGTIDVLYNIAGYLQPGYVNEIDPAEIGRHVDINVKGVMYGTCAAARLMCARGTGHIVNIASMAAFAPIPGLALYSATKYAVRAFSLASAADLKPHGVAVTVVCPDPVATPMLDKQRDRKEAAMTFTAPRILTADEVCARLIGDVLTDRPLEVAMPRSRKWLARVADLLPEATELLMPLFRKQGLAKQAKSRE